MTLKFGNLFFLISRQLLFPGHTFIEEKMLFVTSLIDFSCWKTNQVRKNKELGEHATNLLHVA